MIKLLPGLPFLDISQFVYVSVKGQLVMDVFYLLIIQWNTADFWEKIMDYICGHVSFWNAYHTFKWAYQEGSWICMSRVYKRSLGEVMHKFENKFSSALEISILEIFKIPSNTGVTGLDKLGPGLPLYTVLFKVASNVRSKNFKVSP